MASPELNLATYMVQTVVPLLVEYRQSLAEAGFSDDESFSLCRDLQASILAKSVNQNGQSKVDRRHQNN